VAVNGEVAGFTVGAAMAGVKDGTPRRLDVALIVSDRPCAAAGVFTTNQVIAAPCVVTRRHLERGRLRAIVVNSGNANACTGEQGERDLEDPQEDVHRRRLLFRPRPGGAADVSRI